MDPISTTYDPFVGFSSRLPLFEETTIDGTPSFETAENKLVWFNWQSFPRHKPAGTKRIFCLGGSTTYGRPYEDPFSFSGWLRSFLPIYDPEAKVEVINAGGVSYASYRVAVVFEELLEYEPDVLIIYTGQNEFLEYRTYESLIEESRPGKYLREQLTRTRCWAALDRLVSKSHGRNTIEQKNEFLLPAEVDEMLNHSVGPADYQRDPTWRNQVVQHFAFNLRRMVDLAKQNDVQVIFVSPASNLRGCSPFKSQNSEDLNATQIAAFEDYLYEGHQQNKEGSPEIALSYLEKAERLDARFAHLHFEKGQALFKLKRFKEARESFLRAIDEDVCPLRAISSLTQIIRDVARDTNTPLVDYEARLRERSQREYGHDCLGQEYFLDHVHPTADEYRQLALDLLKKLAEINLVQRSEQFAKLVEIETERVLSTLDITAQATAFRNLSKVFHWAGKFEEALPLAEQALKLVNDDVMSLFVAGECERLLGRPEPAISHFEKLVNLDPFHLHAHVGLGMALSDSERWDDAALHLAMGLGGLQDCWYVHQDYGIVLYHLDELADAVTHLEQANLLEPSNPRTLYHLALTYRAIGDSNSAAELSSELTSLGPEYHTVATELANRLQDPKPSETQNPNNKQTHADLPASQ